MTQMSGKKPVSEGKPKVLAGATLSPHVTSGHVSPVLLCKTSNNCPPPPQCPLPAKPYHWPRPVARTLRPVNPKKLGHWRKHKAAKKLQCKNLHKMVKLETGSDFLLRKPYYR
jgi:hypothetical protein